MQPVRGGMARIHELNELQQRLSWLKSKYDKKYGRAIWNIHCHSDLLNTEVVISGYVLLPSQKYAIQQAAASRLEGKIKYHCAIEVLANINSDCRNSWGRPKTDVLNVYSRPRRQPTTETAWDRCLSSQVTRADQSFRIIFEHRNWLLIQLADHALGWVQTELVDVVNMNGSQKWTPLAQPQIDKPLVPRSNPALVIERALERVGTPYVLGGTTKLGMDCSGLVQRVYKDALGIILPKHSRDQMLIGQSVSFSHRAPGDLIFFLSRLGGRDLHVGLMYDRKRVIHASGRYGFVTVDELSTLASSLDIVRLQRVGGLSITSQYSGFQMNEKA